MIFNHKIALVTDFNKSRFDDNPQIKEMIASRADPSFQDGKGLVSFSVFTNDSGDPCC